MFFLVPIGFGYSVKLKLICTSPCFLCSASTLACPYLVSLLLHRFDYNVVRFHRRYPLKKQAHSILPSTILGKQARGARASALAKHYLGKRRSLLAISSPSQESCDELSMSKALNWVADIVDECLKAGKRVESHQVNPLQISVTEGSSVVFSGLILNHEMPSVANEGTDH